ncbi:hydrogenase formation protein HypD [Candidatus Margulisiibacteriota bacterium]
MKYIEEFGKKSDILKLSKKIKALNVKANLMEVCGTHTMAIFRFGIRKLLPEGVNMISGPGCPVCVTSQEDIDKVIEISKQKNVIMATFGDMMKVPGSKSSLSKEKTKGADIRVVYSPLDSLDIAKENPKKSVVFVGVGFETTTPTIAGTIIQAKKKGIRNFSAFTSHKTVPITLEALLSLGEIKLDGFLCPGHVTAIIGSDAYKEVTEKFKIPSVVAGFEPVDILEGIYMLLRQKKNKEYKVENQYKRVVTKEGNTTAQRIVDELFEPADAAWRGIGVIPGTGLKLRKGYEKFDAEKIFNIKVEKAKVNEDCICGKVLRGVAKPTECRLFSKACTPDTAFGPCMVSSEGTCAAYYKYGRS